MWWVKGVVMVVCEVYHEGMGLVSWCGSGLVVRGKVGMLVIWVLVGWYVWPCGSG